MGFGIDYSDTHENGVIPEGDYEVVIKDAFEDITKRNKKAFISIPLVVRNDVEQSYKNKYIWHQLWKRKEPTQRDKMYCDYSSTQINTLSKVVGLPNEKKYESLEEWLSDLKNRPMLVNVAHEEYNGQKKERVSSIEPTKYPNLKHIFKTKGANANRKNEQALTGFMPIEESVDDDEVPF